MSAIGIIIDCASASAAGAAEYARLVTAATAQARRRRRVKMSYLFLIQHIMHEDEKRALAGAAYFQNPHHTQCTCARTQH